MQVSILRSPQIKSKGEICVPRFAWRTLHPDTRPMPRKTGGRAIPIPIKQALGAELHRLRTSRNQRLEDVAEGAGTDPANIWRIEKGRQTAALDMLFAICAHFGVPVSEVVKAAEGRSAPSAARVSQQALALAQAWDSLPDGGKLKVENSLLEAKSLVRSVPSFFQGATPRRHSFEEKLRALVGGTEATPQTKRRSQ